jgi:hypothetical protein
MSKIYFQQLNHEPEEWYGCLRYMTNHFGDCKRYVHSVREVSKLAHWTVLMLIECTLRQLNGRSGREYRFEVHTTYVLCI